MTLEQLKTAFYQIFNIESELDMDDIQVMWEALMLKNKIQQPEEWEHFIMHINCMASQKFSYFSKVFDEHFNNSEFIYN